MSSRPIDFRQVVLLAVISGLTLAVSIYWQSWLTNIVLLFLPPGTQVLYGFLLGLLLTGIVVFLIWGIIVFYDWYYQKTLAYQKFLPLLQLEETPK